MGSSLPPRVSSAISGSYQRLFRSLLACLYLRGDLTTGSLEPSAGSSWLVGLRQYLALLPELLHRSMPAGRTVRVLTGINKIYAGDDPVNEADPSGLTVMPSNSGIYSLANNGTCGGESSQQNQAVPQLVSYTPPPIIGEPGYTPPPIIGEPSYTPPPELPTVNYNVPVRTPWGWTGSPSWRRAVGVDDIPGTHEDVLGIIPTATQAIALIEAGGGELTRPPEQAHEPPNPHTYPHINYQTSTGERATLRIDDELPPQPILT